MFWRLRVMSAALALVLALVGVALVTHFPLSAASDPNRFPSRPITLVVPLPAGGVSQRLADIIAPALARTLGVPVNVQLMPGESGATGTRHVAKAAADGYTLLVAPSTLLLLDPDILPQAGFEPERDLDPLILAIRAPVVLVVHHHVPATTVPELVRHMNETTPVTFGASGRGSINDLVAGEFFRAAGVKGSMVYFQGGGAVLPALTAGQVHASFQDPSLIRPAVERSQIRTLAVTGSLSSGMLPDVPTFAELGLPQMDAYTWQAVIAPPGLPSSVRRTLEQALRAALLDRAVMNRLEAGGSEVVAAGSRQIERILAGERRRWREIMTSDGGHSVTR
ncbi:tripartite tricarboxylate transporter substrate binding protein [Xanthobacteraceae bacterium A53D]